MNVNVIPVAAILLDTKTRPFTLSHKLKSCLLTSMVEKWHCRNINKPL